MSETCAEYFGVRLNYKAFLMKGDNDQWSGVGSRLVASAGVPKH